MVLFPKTDFIQLGSFSGHLGSPWERGPLLRVSRTRVEKKKEEQKHVCFFQSGMGCVTRASWQGCQNQNVEETRSVYVCGGRGGGKFLYRWIWGLKLCWKQQLCLNWHYSDNVNRCWCSASFCSCSKICSSNSKIGIGNSLSLFIFPYLGYTK